MLRYLAAGIRCLTKPTMVKDTPIHIQIEPTTRCNLKCLTCSRIEVIKHPRDMSLEDFRVIVDTIRPKKITLSGQGEPLLNPKITEMIKYAKAMGSSVNMTTNGTLLKKNLEKVFGSELDLLGVSVDASNSNSYMKIRGGDYFETIVGGIKELVDLKQEFKKQKPKIRTCFVIQWENIEEIVKFIELSYEIGADAVLFQPLDFPKDSKMRKSLMGDMTGEYMKERLKKALEMARKVGILTNLVNILRDFDKCWNKYEFRQENKKGCLFPWFSTYITVDGSLMACCSLAYSEAILGNILRESFTSVWNGLKYCKLREVLAKGKMPYDTCRTCNPPNLANIIDMSRFTPDFIF